MSISRGASITTLTPGWSRDSGLRADGLMGAQDSLVNQDVTRVAVLTLGAVGEQGGRLQTANGRDDAGLELGRVGCKGPPFTVGADFGIHVAEEFDRADAQRGRGAAQFVRPHPSQFLRRADGRLANLTPFAPGGAQDVHRDPALGQHR